MFLNAVGIDIGKLKLERLTVRALMGGGAKGGKDRGHAAGGDQRRLGAFQRRQLAVQRLAIAALKTEIPMTYADMIQYIENSIDVIIQAGRHNGNRGITEFYLPGANETGASQ